jgi:peptidoglycan hydrolase-like protein with peptidoglycan-binding domain/ribosomal protein L6P/L9E
MKKTLVTVACALALITATSVVPSGSKFGVFGVDTVSAATGETETHAAPAAPGKTSNPAKQGGSASGYTATNIARFLELNSAGGDVKTLQAALNAKGYNLVEDGFFGGLTQAAVKSFQKANGLVADGVVGPKTLAVLSPSVVSAAPTSIVLVGSNGSDVVYLQSGLNKLGYKLTVDGIFGNHTAAAVRDFQKANSLAVDGIAGQMTFAKLAEKTTVPSTPAQPAVTGQVSVKLGRVDYAAHGTKSFANAAVALVGDKISAISVDEYQYVDPASYKGVPNSDKDFGKYYPTTPKALALASKLTNAAAYSAGMIKSGATQAWDVNMTGVEKFALGKTVAELEAAIKANPADPKVDAVTSATFTDTNGYLTSILEAAKAARENTSVQIDAAHAGHLKIGRVEYAAHGTKSFAVGVAVLLGDKIVASSVDEYQFSAAASYVGVPNSDKDFGKNFPTAPSALVLQNKRKNSDAYSAGMIKSGATQTWAVNMDGIEKFATGKTIAELEAAIKSNPADPKVDAVTSATFTDTNGYLTTVLEAAKKAK